VRATPVPVPQAGGRTLAERHTPPEIVTAVGRFLRSFQVLLGSSRLYEKNHPRVLDNLEAAERNLRAAQALFTPVTIAIERGQFVLTTLRGQALPDRCGELHTLAGDLSRCGVTSLSFLPEINLGELDTLARLLTSSPKKVNAARARAPDWPGLLDEQRIVGIRINVLPERIVDSVLTSVIASLPAYGGARPQPVATPERAGEKLSETDPRVAAKRSGAATQEGLAAALGLLARIVVPIESGRESSPQEAERAFHAALAEAERGTVNLLAAAVSRQTPHDGETPEAFLARLADMLVLEFVGEEFRTGRVAPPELRGLLARLCGELAGEAGRLAPEATGTPQAISSVISQWVDECFAERLYEAFWAELPAREKAEVLRNRNAWCVPAAALRQYLEQLLDAGSEGLADASPREARLLLLNFVRCLESKEGRARRAVAASLAEFQPLIERLWPHQLPEELDRSIVRALASESSPGIAGLLAALTENLARLAIVKADYAAFARVLESLERAPHDPEHAHLVTLAARIVADERWLLLVDAALVNRPLDPILPRLLRRDPERLLDRLALLLTAPNSLDALPAMARLLRAIGEPAIGALQGRLFEPRRQRAATAVKLLAAVDPECLVAVLPRALPGWDWSIQDLAVTELARAEAPGTASAFAATVAEAHPMVVPLMLDHIGLSQETAAAPLLLEIAAGRNDRLKDIFTRIKAIEALGRVGASEAAELLHAMLRQRNGLTHVEPAGLRAAAEEALALIENWPSSARVRAEQEALHKAGRSFSRPRRYLRIPLPSPLAAQLQGAYAGPARVRTISLGGAFLESPSRLVVGESLRVEIRAGLRRIQGTAVVRNIAPDGGGVEFVHMKQDDREKLRRLVKRLARS